MDNAQKAIMIGVGLFITIIIISAVLLIVNLGTGLVNDATGELGSMSTTLQSQILQTYDGKILSGTQVKAAMNQYANDASLCVVLCSKEASKDTTADTIVARTGAAYIPSITGKVGSTNVKLSQTSSKDDALISWGTVNGTTTYQRTAQTEFSNSLNTTGIYINTAKNYNSSVVRNSNDTIIGIAFQPVYE